MLGKNFNRDSAVETGVASAVHFAHSTRTERRLDLVGAESDSREEGHLCA